MIPSRDILSYVKAQPFRPIRLNMASGRSFDIRHPEMIKVGKVDLIVFTSVRNNPEIYDHWDTVSLMLIESVSFLDNAISQQ
jgi:hypothetical protein